MSIVESHRIQQPRILFFYALIALLFLVLTARLANQQLFHANEFSERAKHQSERRLLVPGPRGNVYDRNGKLLVGNRPRFAAVLYLAELRSDFRREYINIVTAYRASIKEGDIERSDQPTNDQFSEIARNTVITRYLDELNRILGRQETLDTKDLDRHYKQQLLLPYVLIDDLQPEEYARLIEKLPAKSPLQVYTSSSRYYPYGSAAAHTLGYVKNDQDAPYDEEILGKNVRTFALKGTVGVTGIEEKFDDYLQGETGGALYRVDPAGFKIDPPLEKRTPKQGKNITLSLDIQLQQKAEEALDELHGAAVALDIRTGEVLVMANKPDYDLNIFTKRIPQDIWNKFESEHAFNNQAIDSFYPPGSTFKIITTIAGMRAGILTPDSRANCTGIYMVGNRAFHCDISNGASAVHGDIGLVDAIRQSCDIFYYTYGMQIGQEAIATEARRFRLDKPTGIELPSGKNRAIVPDSAWLKARGEGNWTPGMTANYSIGQGALQVSPLQLACMVASFARGETVTTPTLLHDPNRPDLHTEPIGISKTDYDTIVNGLEQVVVRGTGTLAKVKSIRVAGKTGTAQRISGREKRDIAWFVAFAPVGSPEIAVAVMAEGELNENYHGGAASAPVAKAIIQEYFDQKKKLTPGAVAQR